MDIRSLCERISLPQPMALRVYRFCEDFDFAGAGDLLNGMMDPGTAQESCGRLQTFLGDDPEGVAMLSCQLFCACQVYHRFQKLGIPDDVYFATMGCFTRFVVECSYYKGSFQFDRGWWTWRQLSMRVFRLGQLEYERRDNGTVAIHIPSDSRLAPELVDASLTAARKFLQSFFPECARADFTCRSWLLSPHLTALLEPGSNILSFQQRFSVEEVDDDNRDYIPWLFQTIPGTPPEAYPQRTSLQRKAKAHLLSGGKIGIAFGVIRSK